MKTTLHNFNFTFKKSKFLILFIALFLMNTAYSQIYVDNTATGAGDGSSWADAFTNFRNAVLSSVDGDEIRIATGIYTEGNYVSINKTLLIKGGYNTSTNIQDGRSTFDGENSYRVLYLFNSGSNSLLENLNIVNGNYSFSGGGVHISGGSPTFNNITFSDNFADQSGGALHCLNTSPTLTNVAFINNQSDAHSGGAIRLHNSTLTLSNGTFLNNISNTGGGGAIYNHNNSTANIENTIFQNNTSQSGGAIYNEDASITIKNTSFVENSSNNFGGAIRNDNTIITILNTLFYNNSSGNFGSIMENKDTSPTIINCTLYGDGSTNGAFYNSTASSSPIIHNTVFFNNSGDLSGLGTLDASSSYLASDNTGTDISSVTGFVDLNGATAATIFLDSTNPDGADNQWNTADDGLTLVAGSPLLDVGNNSLNTESFDITGSNRIFNSTIDIGAYELDSTLSITENNLNSTVTVYPNPASEITYIASNKPISKIELYNITGKLVLTATNTNKINVNTFPSGIYLMNIYNNDLKTTKKVVIK